MYEYVCMFVYLYVMYVHSESITTHHITQIISGAVPGKYLQANMDSLVKVILFVIEFILPCLLKTTIWIILLIDGFLMFFSATGSSASLWGLWRLRRRISLSFRYCCWRIILLLKLDPIKSNSLKQLSIYQDKNIFIYLFHCTEDLTLSLINF